MKRLKDWLRQGRQRLGQLGPRGWAAVGLACLLIAGGVVLLAAGNSALPLVPVGAEKATPTELDQAADALGKHQIAAAIDSGRLVVPADQAAQARAVLEAQGLLQTPDAVSPFQQLADKDDIWCTQAQVSKRWQAAKMTTLSHLIGKFPAVRSATVLIEEGAARTLGSASGEPTASVNVELRPGFRMTDELVAAIADLVAGSIAGMKPSAVHIVDSSGRSYRAPDSPSVVGEIFARKAAAEAYFTRKIRAAVLQIDQPLIVVEAQADGNGFRCGQAWVSVPRSYLHAIAGSGASEAQLAQATASGLEKVRQAVIQVVGDKDPADVKVDWYYDTPAEAKAPAEASAQPRGADGRRTLAAAAAALIGLPVVGVLGLLVLRGLPRRDRATSAARHANSQTGPLPAAVGGESADGSPGILQLASTESLLTLLKTEHPQTVAVVLSALNSDKAGAVLAGLPQEMQVDVSRRIAAIDRIDPESLRQVEHALSARAAELPPLKGPQTGGVGRLAEVLRRAGTTAERTVLDSFVAADPGMAESLRTQLFTFEDMVDLPDERLRPVLEGTDPQQLAVALRTAGKRLTQKVFSCMTAPAARRVRGRMEQIGPVRLSNVEAAQQRVVDELLELQPGRYEPCPQNEQVA